MALNLGTNALLSCQIITSRIRQDDCFVCDFLYGMMHSNPQSIKSTIPLKNLLGEIDNDYKTNRQQMHMGRIYID